MAFIHARSALLPDGWHKNVRLGLNDGRFSSIEWNAEPQRDDERHAILLPGMANLHSHAFQRGMAGLAESKGSAPAGTTDSFWSWREQMYRFTLVMTPEHAEAVAAQLYMEMLEAGFSRVGEFHYLHHAPDGTHYDNPAEMAVRIAAAAEDTGIRLTLLPTFYAHSEIGGAPPKPGQIRFISDLDSFANLFEGSKAAIRSLPGSTVGVAPHSLRAVTPVELTAVASLAGEGPIHMHIAEQMGEVDACIVWSGTRPVQWLLDHVNVDKHWCLIHATHMTDIETQGLAASGAVVSLCPVTEGNLGDGIFPAQAFFAAGGAFGIGSDSNILIGIADELRQLEYSQRLKHQLRNVLADDKRSTGRALFERAIQGGRVALQGQEIGLSIGGAADFFSLDMGDASHLAGDAALDGWIFASSAKIDCVWVNGKKCVSAGRHINRQRISQRFKNTMQAIVGS